MKCMKYPFLSESIQKKSPGLLPGPVVISDTAQQKRDSGLHNYLLTVLYLMTVSSDVEINLYDFYGINIFFHYRNYLF